MVDRMNKMKTVITEEKNLYSLRCPKCNSDRLDIDELDIDGDMSGTCIVCFAEVFISPLVYLVEWNYLDESSEA